MTSEPSLKERYESVLERVGEAARRSGRHPDSLVVAVVTKFAAMDQIRELIELGHVDFAENRVQNLIRRASQIEEYLQRLRQLPSARTARLPAVVRWHMIGHLQRNKVRKVIGLVRLVHAVDSLRLAEEIQAAATKLEEPVEVLVQVNTSGEKTKCGVAPAAAPHLVEQIDTMLNLRPRGLMCMAPAFEDPELARPTFERCQELFEDISKSEAAGEQFDILSMGMSSDFEVAIECGANVVRVGSAIFGPPRGDADGDSSDD